jgi:hypothetical protein
MERVHSLRTLASELLSAPAVVLALGFGGLLPFVALTAMALFFPGAWYGVLLTALAQYGAIILSFVGALQWGYAVRSHPGSDGAMARYGWSVMPALIGWISLVLPVWTALRVQALALVLCALMDATWLRLRDAPEWLMPLRWVLTAIGATALVIASLGWGPMHS